MDFLAECEKRLARYRGEISEMGFKRYKAAKLIEVNEREVALLDTELAVAEQAIMEVEQSRRNFETHQAIQDGVPTMEKVLETAEEVPPGDEERTIEEAPDA